MKPTGPFQVLRVFRRAALMSSLLPLVVSAASPTITADPQTGQIHVETDRYSARFDSGTLTWLYSKLSKRALIGNEQHPKNLGNRTGLLVENRPREEPIWLVPSLEGEERSQVEINGTRVTFNGLTANGKVQPGTALAIEVAVDPASGDLLVTASGSAEKECVIGTGVAFSGIMDKYIYYPAVGGGARYSGDITKDKTSLLAAPLEWSNMSMTKRVGLHGGLWNAPVTILASQEDPDAALAVWCEDDIPKYKFCLGGRDGATYVTYEDPPYHANRAARSVTWRINVYDGGWTAAAKPFADSLVQRGFTKGRAPWAKDISVVVSIPNMTRSWIELMERTFPPEDRHRVILKAEDWREPPFDHDMWNYEPRADFKKDAPAAREAGFRTMVYFNPLYLWGNADKIPDEKLRADVKKMQEYVVLDPLGLEKIQLGIVNPAYEPWRRNRVESAANVFKNYGVEGLYLDCAYLFVPDGRGRVDGLTVYEGMAAMMEGFRKAKPDLFLGSEMANELMARWTDFSLHMGIAWATNYELSKARSSHPIVNYLYRDVMGTITHVQYPNSDSRKFHAAEEIAERTGQIVSGTPAFGDWEMKSPSPETKLWLYKARLFARRGLRPWYPEKWEPNVMSYYKAADDTVFVYEETDYGSRLVERAAAGPIIHYGRAWKTERVRTTDGEVIDWIGRSDDGTYIGLDCLGTSAMGFAALDKQLGRTNAGRGYVLFPSSRPDPRLRISELPEGVRIADFQVTDAFATLELGATNEAPAEIRVMMSKPLVRVAASGESSLPFAKGVQNTLTVPVNKPIALIWEEGFIAPFEYGGSFKVPLPKSLGIGPDSSVVRYNLGDWDQKWNASLTGSVNPRPGTVYRFQFEAHKTGEKATKLRVCLVPMGTQGDNVFQSVGGLSIDSTTAQSFAHAGIRNTSMDYAWDHRMGLRIFSEDPAAGNPPPAQVTDLSPLQFIRPELGLSDTSPISFGAVKAGQPSAVSPARRVFNSQTVTASAGTATYVPILYGTAHVSAPADKPYLQSIDDVGVELVGEQAGLFELKGEHATPDGQGIKLLGTNGESGLLGGPQPEGESFSVRFRGSDKPGKYAATVRVVTQAGNVGTVSTGQAGMPLTHLFYVDIPVTAEVRP